MLKQSSQGAVRVLTLEGPLTGEAADTLRDAVAATPTAGRPQLVIDLSASPLLDSAGCEALLDVRDAVAEAGGATHLAGVSPLIDDILSATGVARYFQTYDGVKEAVAQFAR